MRRQPCSLRTRILDLYAHAFSTSNAIRVAKGHQTAPQHTSTKSPRSSSATSRRRRQPAIWTATAADQGPRSQQPAADVRRWRWRREAVNGGGGGGSDRLDRERAGACACACCPAAWAACLPCSAPHAALMMPAPAPCKGARVVLRPSPPTTTTACRSCLALHSPAAAFCRGANHRGHSQPRRRLPARAP